MSRQSIIDNSAIMIGRNNYSQELRKYAITPYSDGKYYSDCSSSVVGAFVLGGYYIDWDNNSSAFLTDSRFHTVPSIQVGDHLINPENYLKVADVLIWPGHCNLVHHIDGGDVYVQDHGSGTPKIRKLYDQEKYTTGDIVVRRLSELDNEEPTNNPENSVLYKVQSGAFGTEANAKVHELLLKEKNFDTFVVMKEGLYTVQCGAFEEQSYASELADRLRLCGFEAYVWEYNKGGSN